MRDEARRYPSKIIDHLWSQVSLPCSLNWGPPCTAPNLPWNPCVKSRCSLREQCVAIFFRKRRSRDGVTYAIPSHILFFTSRPSHKRRHCNALRATSRGVPVQRAVKNVCKVAKVSPRCRRDGTDLHRQPRSGPPPFSRGSKRGFFVGSFSHLHSRIKSMKKLNIEHGMMNAEGRTKRKDAEPQRCKEDRTTFACFAPPRLCVNFPLPSSARNPKLYLILIPSFYTIQEVRVGLIFASVWRVSREMGKALEAAGREPSGVSGGYRVGLEWSPIGLTAISRWSPRAHHRLAIRGTHPERMPAGCQEGLASRGDAACLASTKPGVALR